MDLVIDIYDHIINHCSPLNRCYWPVTNSIQLISLHFQKRKVPFTFQKNSLTFVGFISEICLKLYIEYFKPFHWFNDSFVRASFVPSFVDWLNKVIVLHLKGTPNGFFRSHKVLKFCLMIPLQFIVWKSFECFLT